MFPVTTRNSVGLVIAALLAVGDVVSAFFPTPDGAIGPPLPIVVLGGLLGVATLVAVVVAWRAGRRGRPPDRRGHPRAVGDHRAAGVLRRRPCPGEAAGGGRRRAHGRLRGAGAGPGPSRRVRHRLTPNLDYGRGRGRADRRGAVGPQRRRRLGPALLREEGPDHQPPDQRQPAPLPARHAAPGGAGAHRAAGRDPARGDRRGARDPARRPHAEPPRLAGAVGALAGAARRPDPRPPAPARRLRRLHRVRVPVAGPLPPGEPGGRAGRQGPGPRRLLDAPRTRPDAAVSQTVVPVPQGESRVATRSCRASRQDVVRVHRALSRPRAPPPVPRARR